MTPHAFASVTTVVSAVAVAMTAVSPPDARLHRLGAAALDQARIEPPAANGWREVTLPVEPVEIAAAQLLEFAGRVEVIEPRALRMQLRRLTRRSATLNAA